MKFLITNSFHRDDKGDAALVHVLVDQLLKIDPNADIAISSMEDPREYPKFYLGRNIGSLELYSSSEYHAGLKHLFFKAYVFLALFVVGHSHGKFSWILSHDLEKIYHEYKTADLIVSVGGGYFITKPNFGSRLHLLFALETLNFCKQLGLRVVTAPVSVGPFQNLLEGWYTSRVLKKMDLVLLREDISKKYFVDKNGNLPSNVQRANDSAFAFLPEGDFDIRNIAGAKDGDKVLILSVRNWMKKEKQMVYEQAHADLIDYLAENHPKIKPVFIPQCTFPNVNEDDRLVGKRILNLSKTKNIVLITEDLDYKNVKLAYKNADYVIGTRFHSLVFGLSYNVSGIAIEYEHKTRGIMRDLDLEKWVVPINKINSDMLINLFGRIIEEESDYKKHLSSLMPQYINSKDVVINLFSKTINLGKLYVGNPVSNSKLNRVEVIK